ncbi:MAG: 15-cis-phytoene synthase [Pseudorhodobacter sp.]
MIAPADMDHCRAAIRAGSLSFHTASRLLPARVRDPALALYAFCRLADDAVDEGTDKGGAVLSLRDRLDLVYAGTPRNAPADRAFGAIVDGFDMPRALPEALLEGLAWDAVGRRYATLSGVLDYSARVAAAVGAMMCVLMRARDADTIARACDLGLAMQLTNIARDVGEDACAGRLYLPTDWLAEAGIDPEAFLADPTPDARIRALVARLLAQADRLYARAGAGVARLPLSCRPGIHAAGLIYRGIGQAVAARDHDSITWRAHTSRRQKLGWLAEALVQSGVSAVMPVPALIHARPEPEVAFLVEAAAQGGREASRPERVLDILAQLEAQNRARRGHAAPQSLAFPGE